MIEKTLFFCVSFLLSYAASSEVVPFDPNDCYDPGTIFEENEKNLGFCPCKFGYFGPQCFDIYGCVIGDLRTENCSQEYNGDYDLQWRCAASKNEIVKICTCPDGFRGETCEYILESGLSTWWMTVKNSRKYYEVIYTRPRSVVRTCSDTVLRFIRDYRRLIMFILFIAIFQLAWRHAERQRKRAAQKRETAVSRQFQNQNTRFYGKYLELGSDDGTVRWADSLPEKVKPDFLKIDVVSETTEGSDSTENELNREKENSVNKVHRPCLHI